MIAMMEPRPSGASEALPLGAGISLGADPINVEDAVAEIEAVGSNVALASVVEAKEGTAMDSTEAILAIGRAAIIASHMVLSD